MSIRGDRACHGVEFDVSASHLVIYGLPNLLQCVRSHPFEQYNLPLRVHISVRMSQFVSYAPRTSSGDNDMFVAGSSTTSAKRLTG